MEKKKKTWLLVYLIYLGAIPMLATDMYLPAMPKMVDQFNSTLSLVSLTLVLFFVFFSAAVLVWGTLSDKYGRKPVLIGTSILFTVSSFLCAASPSVYLLIVFRILQAIGGGATISVSMAIMKDVFEGRERGRALAITNMCQVVSPITAPLIGAIILKTLGWRWIFITLGIAGVFVFIGSLLLTETAEKNAEKSLLKTIGNLAKLFKIPGFVAPLPIIAGLGCPVFLFLGASADIYITHFGLSEQTYSLLFGLNAIFSFLGSLLYLLLSRHFGTNKIINASFILLFLSGIGVLLFGIKGPVIFAATIIPATIATTLIRPPGSNLLLEQVDEDAGAASSLMIFVFTFSASLGIQFISFNWDSRITVMGWFYVVTAVGAAVLWPLAYRRCRKI